MCVWNQAYIENYRGDKIRLMKRFAKNCYTLIDPFDISSPNSEISSLHLRNNQVGCYISVGTGENWRPDFEELKPYLVTKQWGSWKGEYYVSDAIGALPVMKSRVDVLSEWGCDYVEFDNMDWFTEETKTKYGIQATQQEADEYIVDLCTYVQLKGMKCMAKNKNLGLEFDSITFESYSSEKNWWVNSDLSHFVDTGKLVVIVHYNERRCGAVLNWYRKKYSTKEISFICENRRKRKYLHYK